MKRSRCMRSLRSALNTLITSSAVLRRIAWPPGRPMTAPGTSGRVRHFVLRAARAARSDDGRSRGAGEEAGAPQGPAQGRLGNAADRTHAPGPLPGRAQELDRGEPDRGVLLLLRRLARAHHRIQGPVAHRRVAARDVHRLGGGRPRPGALHVLRAEPRQAARRALRAPRDGGADRLAGAALQPPVREGREADPGGAAPVPHGDAEDPRPRRPQDEQVVRQRGRAGRGSRAGPQAHHGGGHGSGAEAAARSGPSGDLPHLPSAPRLQPKLAGRDGRSRMPQRRDRLRRLQEDAAREPPPGPREAPRGAPGARADARPRRGAGAARDGEGARHRRADDGQGARRDAARLERGSGDVLVESGISEKAPASPPPLGAGFAVALPQFEGPLDLLLSLIQEHKLDILHVPIAFITDKYLEYMEAARALNLDLAGEYLVMAATLAHIKSRMLLPSQESLEAGGGEPRAHP